MSDSPKDEEISDDLSGFKYKLDEKVFCSHMKKTYEARIQKVKRGQDGSPEYLVHYVGWNKKWDEWAKEERIREYNEENKKIVEEELRKLEREGKLAKGTKGGRQGRASTGTSAGVGKRPRDSDSENPTETPQSLRMRKGKLEQTPVLPAQEPNFDLNLDMSEELALILNRDHHMIEKLNVLVKVPGIITVTQVLNDYVKERSASTDINSLPVIKNFPFSSMNFIARNERSFKISPTNLAPYKYFFEKAALAICDYFEATIYLHLLYELEVAQYHKVMKTSENNSRDVDSFQSETRQAEQTRSTEYRGRGRPSNASDSASSRAASRKAPTKEKKKARDVYGPIHLLRFFAKYHQILQLSDLDENMIVLMKHFFNDFLNFLNEHREKYFLEDAYDFNTKSKELKACTE